jgi:hypothetical protein
MARQLVFIRIQHNRHSERGHLGFLINKPHSSYRQVHIWFGLLQVAFILAILAMVAAAAKKENLRGSESIHFGSPYGAYGTYGAYPYVISGRLPRCSSCVSCRCVFLLSLTAHQKPYDDDNANVTGHFIINLLM